MRVRLYHRESLFSIRSNHFMVTPVYVAIRPIIAVKVVNMLLDDVVSGHLREAHPVAQHAVRAVFVLLLPLVPKRAPAP